MKVKKLRAINNSMRGAILPNYREIITEKTPEKTLLKTLKKKAGRNNSGKITVRHRGGGFRKKYRIIDFKRNKKDIFGMVKTIEYDPNRNTLISLVVYPDGVKRYILTPKGLTTRKF